MQRVENKHETNKLATHLSLVCACRWKMDEVKILAYLALVLLSTHYHGGYKSITVYATSITFFPDERGFPI